MNFIAREQIISKLRARLKIYYADHRIFKIDMKDKKHSLFEITVSISL